MFSLFDPIEALLARPESHSYESVEEADLALQRSYDAFWETKASLRFFRTHKRALRMIQRTRLRI